MIQKALKESQVALENNGPGGALEIKSFEDFIGFSIDFIT